MGRKTKTTGGTETAASFDNGALFTSSTAFDPALATLFSSSAGPVSAPVKRSKPTPIIDRHADIPSGDAGGSDDEQDSDEANDDEDLSEISSPDDDDSVESALLENDALQTDDNSDDDARDINQVASGRSRKRKDEDDDVEAQHLQRLARERSRFDPADRQRKRPKIDTNGYSNASQEDTSPPPVHETLAPSKQDVEVEKASRTVFLGNVSIDAMTSKSSKHTLMAHLATPLAALSTTGNRPHGIESIRFRSTAYAGSIPKKAAFALKDIMETTTKSTNAYVVYSSQSAARAAARSLNGTVVLGRHLRADEVAHPMQVDHKRCVFVGNLGFVDDETAIKNAEAESGLRGFSGKPQNGDVEEGLWRTFGKAGAVESVRVVRDPKTRVGKGFAYVQFADDVAIERALQFHDKKFPPLLPRKLRVVRAKKPSTTAGARERRAKADSDKDRKQNKLRPDGRAAKLFGRAGAANVRRERTGISNVKPPESFVFEGQRASSAKTAMAFKVKKNTSKRSGKPTDRSAKRGAAWKAKAKSGAQKT